MNLLKYIACYITERQHRKCFDKWYCQDIRLTLWSKIDIMILNILSNIYPDYRPFLKKWHTGNKYDRYASYET